MNTIRSAAAPVALAIFACLSLYGANNDYVVFSQVVRPLLVSVALALAAVGSLHWWGLSIERSSLIAALWIIVFYSYGHLYELIEGLRVGDALVGRHRYLLTAVLVLAGSLTWALARRRGPLTVPIQAASTSAAVAVLIAVVSGPGRALVAPEPPPRPAGGGAAWQQPSSGTADRLPDIYYIVLDGYAREDVLRRIYRMDNSDFLDDLESLGFYVAEAAVANYVQTRLSLAAALNMRYVDEIADGLGPELAEVRVDGSIMESRVQQILSENGYEIVAFESGFPYTELTEADIYLTREAEPRFEAQSAGSLQLNSYEALLLNTTILRIPLEWAERNRMRAAAQVYSRPHHDHRLRIRYALMKLPEVARLEGHQFVFVHILAPHPPFVFDAEGEPRVPLRPYSLSDGSSYLVEGSRSEYVDSYRQQVQFLNGELAETVEKILANSEVPPVIILQGDHGPGAYLDWNSAAGTDLEERTSILNAVYLQGERSEEFYSGLSSVNTFRVVFNWLFDPDEAILADRSYFSPNWASFDFTEVE